MKELEALNSLFPNKQNTITTDSNSFQKFCNYDLELDAKYNNSLNWTKDISDSSLEWFN